MKHLLQVNDRIVAVVSTHNPALRASTSKESTEVLCINQDPRLQRQIHHLFWSFSVIKLLLNLRITINLIAEVIQGIQKWLRDGAHTRAAETPQRYLSAKRPQH